MYKNGFTAMLRKNKVSAMKDKTSTLGESGSSVSDSNVYDKGVPTTVGIIPNIRTTLMINIVVKKRF
jgi:hypothetical protein